MRIYVLFVVVIDIKSNISLRRNDDKRGVSGDLYCCVCPNAKKNSSAKINKTC